MKPEGSGGSRIRTARSFISTSGGERPAPGEWKSLIDVIVPFGGQDKAIAEVRETALKGRRVKAFQSAPGGGTAVIEW